MEGKAKNEKTDSDSKLDFSAWAICGIFAVVLLAYPVSRFGFGISAGDLGQLGDYVGGLMNPIVALGAFYWIATSVKLQQKELAETREALTASQAAQEGHAETALKSAQIESLNVRLSTITSRLHHIRSRLNELYSLQATQSGDMEIFDDDGRKTLLKKVIWKVEADMDRQEGRERLLLIRIELLSGALFDDYIPMEPEDEGEPN